MTAKRYDCRQWPAGQRLPEQRRPHQTIDNSRRFIGIDGNRSMVSNQESGIRASDSALPVRIKCLPVDPANTEMCAQCFSDLSLESPPASPQVCSGRQPSTRIESDGIRLGTKPRCGLQANHVRPKPLQIRDLSRETAKADGGAINRDFRRCKRQKVEFIEREGPLGFERQEYF